MVKIGNPANFKIWQDVECRLYCLPVVVSCGELMQFVQICIDGDGVVTKIVSADACLTRSECRKNGFNYNNPDYLILAEHKYFTRTASGKSWKSKFTFISKKRLLLNAGWRETEIVNNAKSWKMEVIDNKKYLHLFTDTNDVTASGTFDFSHNTWRG